MLDTSRSIHSNLMEQSDESEYKVIVLGAATVGKSSITIRFVNNEFIKEYSPTLQDKFKKTINYQDKQLIKMEIVDTAGQEDYIAMQDVWIQEGHGYIIVYAINSKESYEYIKDIRAKIERIRNTKDIPMILVANKSDLEYEGERQVAKEQGQNLATVDYKCPFFETSAKTGQNCEKVFFEIITEILKRKKTLNMSISQEKQHKDKGICSCCNIF